ncbi:hypothetical protein LIA77_02170 [Sarocladium implicatum]|nr:hypothetical protein LIA77_02170 [Sarocladium implicatum]
MPIGTHDAPEPHCWASHAGWRLGRCQREVPRHVSCCVESMPGGVCRQRQVNQSLHGSSCWQVRTLDTAGVRVPMQAQVPTHQLQSLYFRNHMRYYSCHRAMIKFSRCGAWNGLREPCCSHCPSNKDAKVFQG